MFLESTNIYIHKIPILFRKNYCSFTKTAFFKTLFKMNKKTTLKIDERNFWNIFHLIINR